MKKHVIAFVAAVLACWLSGSAAMACSCIPLTVKEATDLVPVVFEGQVIDRNVVIGEIRPKLFDHPTDRVVRFRVTRVIKGSVPAEADVYTLSSGSMCGETFEDLKQEIVLVGSPTVAPLTTNYCLRRALNPPPPASMMFPKP